MTLAVAAPNGTTILNVTKQYQERTSLYLLNFRRLTSTTVDVPHR